LPIHPVGNFHKSYDINDYTFYARTQENKSVNQNSSVWIDGYNYEGKRETYYEFIVEIWELEYRENLKVMLFCCQWVGFPNGVNIDKYGMTTVNFKLVDYREQSFVRAKDVIQVFYTNDPGLANTEECHIILQEKRKNIGIENVVDEEDYNQFDDLPPLGEDITTPITDDIEEPPYIRCDHDEAIIVK
jgi:hypothetical protein